jgi:hypothetical protein
MVRPNGIGVGGRVSLQGPVRDAHGEAPELGAVRTRLAVLKDPLQWDRSVVFIGSFIKPVSGAVAVARAYS